MQATGYVKKAGSDLGVFHKVILPMAAFIGISLLAACSSGLSTSADPQAVETAMPAVPTQADGQQFELVNNQSCLIKELVSIQISDQQGDLIAWSPVSDELGFIEPDNQHWQFYVGQLALYSPAWDVIKVLTSDQEVFGDITWSPDGLSIAYISLNTVEEQYSVNLVDHDGNSRMDVFGDFNQARTDSWTSKKGISAWTPENDLILTSSCGADCARRYSYSPMTSSLVVTGEKRWSEDDSLAPNSNAESTNDKWTIQADKNDNMWLIATDRGEISLLLLDTAIDEIKWSSSSSYFALRTSDKILVYKPVCPKK